tara:strand:- start:7702 stop:8142 length:441 start_codon:yes stop_codon:yes gene_type:complete
MHDNIEYIIGGKKYRDDDSESLGGKYIITATPGDVLRLTMYMADMQAQNGEGENLEQHWSLSDFFGLERSDPIGGGEVFYSDRTLKFRRYSQQYKGTPLVVLEGFTQLLGVEGELLIESSRVKWENWIPLGFTEEQDNEARERLGI